CTRGHARLRAEPQILAVVGLRLTAPITAAACLVPGPIVYLHPGYTSLANPFLHLFASLLSIPLCIKAIPWYRVQLQSPSAENRPLRVSPPRRLRKNRRGL